MTLPTRQPVQIDWEDSYGSSSRWEDIDPAGKPEVMLCRSVGWVVRQSARCVTLCPHVAENERMGVRQGCGDMVIPKAAIVRVLRLTSSACRRRRPSSVPAKGRSRKRS